MFHRFVVSQLVCSLLNPRLVVLGPVTARSWLHKNPVTRGDPGFRSYGSWVLLDTGRYHVDSIFMIHIYIDYDDSGYWTCLLDR